MYIQSIASGHQSRPSFGHINLAKNSILHPSKLLGEELGKEFIKQAKELKNVSVNIGHDKISISRILPEKEKHFIDLEIPVGEPTSRTKTPTGPYMGHRYLKFVDGTRVLEIEPTDARVTKYGDTFYGKLFSAIEIAAQRLENPENGFRLIKDIYGN